MDYDEDDPQAAYLRIARLFLPELLSRLKNGTLMAPVEVVLSDTDGTVGSWQVDGFGKFTDLADSARKLRLLHFPVEVLFTDRKGPNWSKRIAKEEVDEGQP